MTAEALPDTEIMIRRGHLDQLVAAVETVTVTEPCTAWCSGTCRGTHDIRPYFGGWSGKLQAMLAELDVPCKAGDLLAVLRRWSGLDPCHSYHQPAEAYCDQTGARIRRHPVGTRDAALALKAKITKLERLRLVPVPDTADPGPPPACTGCTASTAARRSTRSGRTPPSSTARPIARRGSGSATGNGSCCRRRDASSRKDDPVWRTAWCAYRPLTAMRAIHSRNHGC